MFYKFSNLIVLSKFKLTSKYFHYFLQFTLNNCIKIGREMILLLFSLTNVFNANSIGFFSYFYMQTLQELFDFAKN